MSNFCYQDNQGNIIQVPARYGDMSRQVAAILNKNTENVVPSAPFISCYVKDLKFNRPWMQDPTFIGKKNIRERAIDPTTGDFLNYQGSNYTIERIMPTPYEITFNADIWTSNTDQKLQLWEQITVLFNPSMEIQTSDNYIDWTSLSYLEITDNSVFESKQIPQGVSNDLSIATLQFKGPIWITPPAKVKKLGIITKIIANIFTEPTGTGENGGYDDALSGGNIFGGENPDARITVTLGDFDLLILNNTAVLVPVHEQLVSEQWISVDDVPNRPSWLSILDRYPGSFTPGLSQIRLSKPDGNEIVGYLTLNPSNDSLMQVSIDQDTIPTNTILTDNSGEFSRGTIDAIINPLEFNPNSFPEENIDGRYLILEDIVLNNVVEGPSAWASITEVPNNPTGFMANANDIIQWDGNQWWQLFNSTATTTTTYITNAYTGIQYKWNGNSWVKSFEGIYSNTNWSLLL